MSALHFENINSFLIIISALTGVFCVITFLLRQKINLAIIFLRTVTILSLSLYILKPYWQTERAQEQVTLLVDVSASVNSEFLQKSFDILKDLNLTAPEIKVFGVDVKSSESLNIKPESYPADFRKDTNLEKALSETNGAVVLITDGFETQGDVLSLYKNPGESPVYPIIPDSESVQGFLLEPLSWPHFADQDAILNLSIGYQSAGPVKSSLEVSQNSKNIFNQNYSGKINKSINIKSEKIVPGLNTFEIKYNDDQGRKINRKYYVNGKLRKKILLISNNTEEERYLKEILVALKYKVDSRMASEALSFPADSESISSIIFNNVPHKFVSSEFSEKLISYVNNGGSFLMIGGNSSFGLGGYYKTEIAGILPVEVIEPEKTQKRLNVAVELVLDKSGSMKSSSKIDFTKLAAQAVINALKPEDYIGIIGFDSQPFIAMEIGLLEKIRSKALSRVGLLFPNGSTNLYAAMDAANSELEKAQAGRKHMIVLTDGELPDAVPMGQRYLDFAGRLKLSGITVSTFLIAAEDSKLIAQIAANGGGVFHKTDSPENLPRLFLEDLKVNTGDRTQKEYSVYQTERFIREPYATALAAFPQLYGYVSSRKKESAVTELVISNSEEKDPLLAFGKSGAGRTAAFTSDVNSRWARDWLDWKGLTAFWSDVIQEMQSGEGNSDFDYEAKTYFQGSEAVLELTVYSPSNPDLQGTLSQDSSEQGLEFLKLSRGRYAAHIKFSGEKELDFKFGLGRNHTENIKVFPPPDNRKEEPRGINLPVLYRLAELSGGSVNPDKLIKPEQNAQPLRKDLSLYLLLIGMFAVLIEIILRERLQPK